jgi:hypothetical protein
MFRTKRDAEEAYVRERNAATVLGIALQDIANNKVQWVHRSRNWVIGLSRLDGAHGGILIQKDLTSLGDSPYVTAHYAEKWVSSFLKHFELCPPKDCVDGALRDLVFKIHGILQKNHEQLLQKARGGK